MKRAGLRKSGVAILFWMVVLGTIPSAESQDARGLQTRSDIENDLRLQPYVYAGPASFISYGGSAFEFGGGMDWLVYKGLGLGFDLSILGDGYSAVAGGSLNLSYHFIPSSPRFVPFVLVGMGGAGAPEYGLDGWTWVNLGGGLNYWLGNGMAMRVEARGRFDPEYGDHVVGLRMGVTF